MIDNNAEVYNMGELHIAYDIRSLNILNDFLAGIIRLLSASPGEEKNLQLIAEEIFTHVLYNHTVVTPKEMIIVHCRFNNAKSLLELDFHYMGKPIRKDDVVQYNRSDISSENIEKLWCFLARELSDSFEIINRGNDGWRIVCAKKLEGAFYSRHIPIQKKDSDSAIAPTRGKRFVYRQAVPEDAYALVELTHKTYAYSYAEPDFYYADQLAHALEAGTIVSVIAETENSGDIVAHAGLMYYPDIPHCCEVGMLMVAPEYQGSRLAFNISKKVLLLLDDPEYKRDIAYSVFTTAHPISQHMGERMSGLMPTMLMVSSCPMADYEKTADMPLNRRETLLFAAQLLYDSECTVFIPHEHQSVMSLLFEQMNSGIAFANDTVAANSEKTCLNVQCFERSGSANLIIETFSQDWVDVVRREMYALRCRDILTIYILVPADVPPPDNMREQMKNLNAFFAGMLIFEKDRWYSAYAAPGAELIDFESIVIYNDNAKKLLQHIKEESDYVFGIS